MYYLHPESNYQYLGNHRNVNLGSRSIVSRRNPNKTTVSGGHGGSQERLNLPVLYFV
ncbi:hypothetical protein PGT21_006574 [Puccinia graminis f. sp. tritici]|uniref:Uncharacterized protein n=1 Tax=Puccinia graminis f. sp. tritici TaxID=56615 RepID=A0A5B0LKW1_PUCGR|nr:hypothetical protein PGTUg99_003097 [Puccinia graminis f. sp. tritici]KAA1103103.1 hypothetical protein PGT21_006574 [Puccinia graminis f. sp. tritici]